MNAQRLQTFLKRFPRQHILVVGDVMLDQFIWGKVTRISPEAPVPVVEVQRESYFPGGAANVARNLRALGARVSVLGVIGSDQSGQTLRELLAEGGIDTSGLLTDVRRPTTVKTRVVAHHQQVVRFDREQTAPLLSEQEDALARCYVRALQEADAVIFEDYGKGVLSQRLFDRLHEQARRCGKITSADPNPRHLLRYRGLTAITPNRLEAFVAAGVTPAEPAGEVLEDRALLQVGEILLKKWRPQNLLITLGEQGMCLFRAGKPPHHIPTVAREVFDVSGAGDTAIATFTLALAAGAGAVEAAVIANHAAGVVVGKVGTATCSPQELLESFRRNARGA
ncbi:MAG: D-glycero-beta-D-manno-heptose-7-phosphate kinase [Verrucomicrobiae bacterium]|nr:D-glycero-beta-D-manno-heptose-7-phosphate kinase [Verrucomicrobiae bacterium]